MKKEKAIFAAGCFWHIEEVFSKIPGVIKTKVGYTGGNLENPTYEQVSSGNTNHVEAIEIIFDSEKITYPELLNHFWMIHNPTSLNRQGLDIGTNYGSAIFYTSNIQKKQAEESKKQIQIKFKKPIITKITKASIFYPAEEYHQKYFEKQGRTCKI